MNSDTDAIERLINRTVGFVGCGQLAHDAAAQLASLREQVEGLEKERDACITTAHAILNEQIKVTNELAQAREALKVKDEALSDLTLSAWEVLYCTPENRSTYPDGPCININERRALVAAATKADAALSSPSFEPGRGNQ